MIDPMDGKEGNVPVDLDDAVTDLMQGHLDDVSGASSSHNSWRQGFTSTSPMEN